MPFDLLGGVGTAQFASLVRAQVLAVGHFDFVLDRQAMAVPTRHIRRIEAGQGLGADDHVLENFVQRMTDVNRAVGIRRTVVKDELRTILANLAQLPVQANAVPALQDLRFALWQAGLHWEGGVRKVKRGFVVGHFRLFLSGEPCQWARATATSALIAVLSASREANRCSSRSLWWKTTVKRRP